MSAGMLDCLRLKMSIVDRVIDVFEKRVSALEKIRYLPDLPQWTDADVIEASCLIEQYRNLTSQFSGQDEAWFCSTCKNDENHGESCDSCGEPRR